MRGRPSNAHRDEVKVNPLIEVRVGVLKPAVNEEKAIEEIGYTELRTTEAKIQDYPIFKNGCPQCGEKPVVTMSRLFDLNGTREVRICRCRTCSWHGKLRN